VSFEDPDREMVESEPLRYRRVPNVPGRTQYRWMEEFVDALEDADVADKLRIALAGRGAFGRFRDVLSQWPDLEQRWYAQRQQMMVEQALEWLQGLEIEPLYELPGAEPPPPSTRSRGARLSLVHVLVAAPPTGVHADGVLGRVVKSEDAGTARALFKALAREWCEMRGVGFRKRFVDGKNEFELEGLKLRVDAERVEVTVTVPPEVLRTLSG
jgi:hypothetical protein